MTMCLAPPSSVGAGPRSTPATATRPPGPSPESDAGHSDEWRAGFDAGYAEGRREDDDRERYRLALERIARAESGVWGMIAHEALYPTGREHRR